MRVALLVVLASCASAPSAPAIVVPPPPVATAPSAKPRAAAPPPADVAPGPEAPAIRPLDAKHKVDGGPLFLGANATDAWVTLVDGTTVVVNRATGCATESYPNAPALALLHEGNDAAAALARPDVLAALRDVVGLGRRFRARGQRFVSDLAWTPDGKHIFLQISERVFHSANGGRSFAPMDDHRGSRLATSSDGGYLLYERCVDATCGRREYVSVALDGSREVAPVTSGQTLFLRMGEGAQALFWRSNSEVCLDTFDLVNPGLASTRCVPVPPAAKPLWPSREFVSVSPSGNYGIVKWDEGRPNLTYVVSLVDMKTGALSKTVTDLLGEVDDEGDMVMSDTSEGRGDHTWFLPMTGPKKLLGDHSLLAWTDKVAMLGIFGGGTLGWRKCDLVKFVKTP